MWKCTWLKCAAHRTRERLMCIAYLDRAVLALVEVIRVAVAVLVILVGDFVRLVGPVAENVCVKSVV
jgi:hypothetical protein